MKSSINCKPTIVAILLRFFEQLDFRAVGEAMGSSEEAARKRESHPGKAGGLAPAPGVVLSAVAPRGRPANPAIIAAPAPAIHCQNELRQELDAGFSWLCPRKTRAKSANHFDAVASLLPGEVPKRNLVSNQPI